MLSVLFLMVLDSHFGAERGLSALQSPSWHCLSTTKLHPIKNYLLLAVATLWSILALPNMHIKAAPSASECLPCRSGVRQ